MNGYYLTKLADLMAGSLEISHWTISYRAVGKGDLFARIRQGKGITIATYNRVLQYFSDHWPIDLLWPLDIPRPNPAPDSPAMQALIASLGAPSPDADLNESTNDSGPRALNARGHIVDPKAFCRGLSPTITGVDDTRLIASMLDTYYQVIAQYADGRPRADKYPRKRSNAARVLDALVAAGDTRFAVRAAREQELAALAQKFGLAS